MHRHFLQAWLQRSGSLTVGSHSTHFLRHGWCIKRFPNLTNIGQQMTVFQRTQKQWLHLSVPPCNNSVKKAFDEPSQQSEDPLQKESESEKANASSISISTQEPVSSGAPDASTGPDSVETDPLQDQSLSLLQRFKRTFKQYGKVLIPVHLVTSSIWFGSFYYAAMKGVNVTPFLEFIGLPESIVGILKNSQSGNALTAYALYKIATPARYTVTLGGTSISVKYLRKYGYMSTPPPVKDYIQDRMEETKERFTGKIEETKDIISGKMGETKDLISGKIQETKDKVSFMKKKE